MTFDHIIECKKRSNNANLALYRQMKIIADLPWKLHPAVTGVFTANAPLPLLGPPEGGVSRRLALLAGVHTTVGPGSAAWIGDAAISGSAHRRDAVPRAAAPDAQVIETDPFHRYVRSAEVNGLGSEMMRANKKGYNCALKESNAAGQIWDRRDAEGFRGATACVVVPSFWDRFQAEGDWQKLVWWIHDILPYSSLQFFPRYWAFNISWHERSERHTDSFSKPTGCLTKPGMENHEGCHEKRWRAIV